MADRYRANYALLPVLEHLGPSANSLDVPWAAFGGDRSSSYEFSVPTDDPVDAYLEVQAYDVGTFGHELLLNGDPLAGFDLPPRDGWNYWMDSVADRRLEAGTNTVRIRRDVDSADAFAVGNVVVNWREPAAEP